MDVLKKITILVKNMAYFVPERQLEIFSSTNSRVNAYLYFGIRFY